MKKISTIALMSVLTFSSANAGIIDLGLGALDLIAGLLLAQDGDTLSLGAGASLDVGILSANVGVGVNLVGGIPASGGLLATINFNTTPSSMIFNGAYTSSIENIIISGRPLNLSYNIINYQNLNINNVNFTNFGGIANNGTLSISNGTFSNFYNLTRSGGAIINNLDKSLTLSSSNSFTGDGATINGVSGGAIYNLGDLTITDGNTIFQKLVASASGGAIYNTGSNFLLGSNIEFNANTAATLGGAIYNTGNINWIAGKTGNISFTGNTAASSGGGIYSIDGAIDLTGVIGNILFSGNKSSGGNGGAINSGGDLSISVASPSNTIIFTGNSAGNFGGAIYQAIGDLNIGDGVAFTNNTSVNNGGAIYNVASATIGDSTNFIRNSATSDSATGGAIYNGGAFTIGTNAIFGNNSASYGGAIGNIGGTMNIGMNTVSPNNSATFTGNSSGTRGGAIYNSGTLNLGVGTIFSGNYISGTNGDGGAIYNTSSTAVINIDDDVQFTGNTAVGAGGAIYNYSGGSQVIIGDNALFDKNSAGVYGGAIENGAGSKVELGDNAIFSNNTSGSNGGAIDNFGSILLGDNASFTGNASVGNGGAVYAAVNGLLEFGGKISFEGNTGASGGAIALISGGQMALSTGATGDIVFDKNISTAQFGGGGAIYNLSSEFDLTDVKGNIEFTGNSATGQGGAIYSGSSAIMNIGAADGYLMTFNGNTAVNNGGAIYNDSAMNLLGKVIFENNASVDSGGAIYNYNGALTLVGGMEFYNNVAGTGGGALDNQSGGTIKLSGDGTGGFIFSGNQASGAPGGGAIYNLGTSSVDLSNVNGDIVFTGNKATTAIGGAITNSGNGIVNIGVMDGFTTTFDGNTAEVYGGAIASNATSATATGTVNVTGKAIFENNVANGSGGAIYSRYSTINLDKDAEFTNNNSNNNGGAIYSTNSTINIGQDTLFDGNGTINNGGALIAYTSTINIAGGTTFDNNTATGHGGAIYNYDSLITLDTTLGNIEFTGNKSASTSDGDIYNNTNAIINIVGDTGTISSDSGFYNKGSIIKTGANTLDITGMASGEGTFTQTAGITNASNGFFTGGITKTSVSNSDLNVTSTIYNYGVTLGDNGKLFHTDTTNGTSIIDLTTLVFSGANASASFDMTGGILGNYNLGKVDNGSTNFITVNNSTVFLTESDYKGGTQYTLNNDTISLSGPNQTLRTVEFDNLNTTNTILNFDVTAKPVDGVETFTSDKLIANTYSGDDLILGIIRVLGDGDSGLTSDAVNSVLGGQAKFAAGGTTEIATTAYEYKATVNADRTGLDLTVVDESSNMSLNNMNIDINGAINRGFNFSYFNEGEVYAIGSSLGEMAVGTFAVTGFDGDATHSAIDGGGDKSMFTMTNDTDFTLSNLTIQNAMTNSTINPKSSGSGAGLFIDNADATVNVSNVIFQNNNASILGGGMAVIDVGVLNMTDLVFRNNTSNEGGGLFSEISNLNFYGNTVFENNTALIGAGMTAVSFEPEGLNINFDGNATFKGNGTDSETGSAGAILAEATAGDLNLNFAKDAIFDSNKAGTAAGALYALATAGNVDVVFNGNTTLTNNSSTGTQGLGGAIIVGSLDASKTGNLIFNMNENTTVLFDNNYDSLGANDILLYSLVGAIYFSGTGGTATLNGGIADIEGYEKTVLDVDYPATTNVYVDGNVTVNFGANSINQNFTGDYNQSAGVTNVYTNNWVKGTNYISTGGRMNMYQSLSVNNIDLRTGGILDIRNAANGGGAGSIRNIPSPTGGTPNTLTMANFSGDSTGLVYMSTDGSIAGTDKLVITNSATGGAILNFTTIGSSPIDNKIQVVDLNSAIDKSAVFKLAGDTVEVGAWEYGLGKDLGDSNWYLTSTGTPTPMAQTIMGIPALHLSIVKSGMNELRKRMGDLRNNNDNDDITGAWIRTYGKSMKITDKAETKLNLWGIEGGVDAMIDAYDSKIYLGAMIGTLESNDIKVTTSLGKEAKGWTKSPSVGLYATWIQQEDDDSGWFVDLTGRFFRVHDKITRNDISNGYDVKRNFWAFSAETGRSFVVDAGIESQFSIEPKVELRYKRGEGLGFTTFDGTSGYVDSTDSFSTRFNVQANYLPNGKDSTWKPFVELGIYEEWMGKTKMRFAESNLTSSDTSGFGFEATLGANATISDNAYFYGAFTYENGDVYESFLLNLGLRVKF